MFLSGRCPPFKFDGAKDMGSLSSFSLFTRLPFEIRIQIWEFATQDRVLEVIYDYNSPQPHWKISPTSFPRNSIANICHEARKPYTFLFGTYVLLQRDTFVVGDEHFLSRSLQNEFIAEGWAIKNLAITNEIWWELQRVACRYRDVYPWVISIISQFTMLENFILAVTPDDCDPHPPDTSDDEPWSESQAFQLLVESMDADLPTLHAREMKKLDEASPLPLDEDGQVSLAARADRWLEAMEVTNAIYLKMARYARPRRYFTLRGAADYDPEGTGESHMSEMCAEVSKSLHELFEEEWDHDACSHPDVCSHPELQWAVIRYYTCPWSSWLEPSGYLLG